MAFLSRDVLQTMDFASLGENVLISDKASLYNCEKIAIGNNVRIDDYCILSAGDEGISIGNFIHIAAYSSLIGAGKITISDYCNLSSRVSIYSSSDDYSGLTMTNPMVPDEFKNVTHSSVVLRKHVIVGCGTVILPGVELEEGVAIGALSLIKKSCKAYGIYAGSPATLIKERRRDFLELEVTFHEMFCADKKDVDVES